MGWEWFSGVAGDDVGDCISKGWWWVEGCRSWGAMTLWRRQEECWEAWFVAKEFYRNVFGTLEARWVVKGAHQAFDDPTCHGPRTPVEAVAAALPGTPEQPLFVGAPRTSGMGATGGASGTPGGGATAGTRGIYEVAETCSAPGTPGMGATWGAPGTPGVASIVGARDAS